MHQVLFTIEIEKRLWPIFQYNNMFEKTRENVFSTVDLKRLNDDLRKRHAQKYFISISI